MTDLALPELSRGYGELVQKLRSDSALAAEAKAHGVDALLASDSPAMQALKKGNKELVTQAEKSAEKKMADAVREAFPAHAIVGEEHGFQPGSDTRWVFDPIDGTSAMIRTAMSEAFGLPLPEPKPAFGVTVAMAEGAEATLGVVAELEAKHGGLVITNMYVGEKGKRSTCNGTPITLPAGKSELKDAQLACTVPEIMFGTQEKWGGYQSLLDATGKPCLTDQNCIGFMRLMRDVDVAYEADLAYHDAAALIPILQGAGIKVTGSKGEALTFPEAAIKSEYHVLAAQEKLHAAALARVIAQVPERENRFAAHSGVHQGYASKFPS